MPTEAAANSLGVEQVCAAGKVQVTFTWTGNSSTALQQAVDLSFYNNAWKDGTFAGSGFLPSSATSHIWGGLPNSTDHYVRVDQQMSNGAWEASQTFHFVSTSCGGQAPVASTVAAGVGDGTWIVGTDIMPGTYRTRSDSGDCYWARLHGFGGSEIIGNNISPGPQIVTILASDQGFESDGCGTWTNDLSSITGSPTSPFSDGTYFVGKDIAAGTWRASDASDCYWVRLSDFQEGIHSIIDNDFSGVVTIAAQDTGFRSESCGTWTKIR